MQERNEQKKKSIREQMQIYHFTELGNLDLIIKYGILSRAEIDRKGLKFRDVADPKMLNARKDYGLEKYVPFHFMGNSPFAGKVRKENPDLDFIYLAMPRTRAGLLHFKISPSHPRNMEEFQLYDYDEGIKIIDWDTMDKKDYKDHYCKEVCMAECLYDKEVSLDYIQGIYVKDNYIKKIVENKLLINGYDRIYVTPMKQWF